MIWASCSTGISVTSRAAMRTPPRACPRRESESGMVSAELAAAFPAVVLALLFVLGAALGLLVHPAFWGLSAFVGAGLFVAGATGFCGMARLLAIMPWNRRMKRV